MPAQAGCLFPCGPEHCLACVPCRTRSPTCRSARSCASRPAASHRSGRAPRSRADVCVVGAGHRRALGGGGVGEARPRRRARRRAAGARRTDGELADRAVLRRLRQRAASTAGSPTGSSTTSSPTSSATGDIFYRVGHTTTVGYDEVRLGRWVEDTVARARHPGAHRGVARRRRRERRPRSSRARFATRYGPVEVRAARLRRRQRRRRAGLGGRAAVPAARPGRSTASSSSSSRT